MRRPLRLGTIALLAAGVTAIVALRQSGSPPQMLPRPTIKSEQPVAIVSGPTLRLANAPAGVVSPAVAPAPDSAKPPEAASAAPAFPSHEGAARLQGIFKAFPQQKQLFEALRAEARDPKWAPRSEAMLTDLYAAMPHAGEQRRVLDIYCGSSNCVAMGDLPSQNLHGEVSQAMSAIQSIDLVKNLMAKGYTPNGSAFGPSSADNREMFVTFYKRSVPVEVKLRPS